MFRFVEQIPHAGVFQYTPRAPPKHGEFSSNLLLMITSRIKQVPCFSFTSLFFFFFTHDVQMSPNVVRTRENFLWWSKPGLRKRCLQTMSTKHWTLVFLLLITMHTDSAWTESVQLCRWNKISNKIHQKGSVSGGFSIHGKRFQGGIRKITKAWILANVWGKEDNVVYFFELLIASVVCKMQNRDLSWSARKRFKHCMSLS